MENSEAELLITGTQVNYYFICKTKLWLFSRSITMEQESDLVRLGKLLHEHSYEDKEKDVIFKRIVIDFVRKGDYIEIHEVKKSDRLEFAHLNQVLYYIYYLKKHGIKAKAVINYPKLKRRIFLKLDGEKESFIENILEDIKRIVSLKSPPKPKRKGYCKSCAYYELCFS